MIDWEQFAVTLFNKVHSNFLIMWKEKFPNLKRHELKALCLPENELNK
jgi:hypothetical protein